MAVSPPIRIALIGGGLHNLLLAARLLKVQQEDPQHESNRLLEVHIFEARQSFDSDKTISCHASDVPKDWENDLEPFWRRKWPSYRVRFPEQPFKSVPIGYHSLHLAALAEHIQKAASQPGSPLKIHFSCPVSALPEDFDWVIDSASNPAQQTRLAGVQQFFGQTLSFREPHGVSLPVVMDCSVPQSGGFCFVYVLPMSPHDLLIEDTRLLRETQNWKHLEDGVTAYLLNLGLENLPYTIVHEERGTLPIPLCSFSRWLGLQTKPDANRTRHERKADAAPRLIPVGFQAGYFHPTTGYSLPLALRSVDSLCLDIKTAGLGSNGNGQSTSSPHSRKCTSNFESFVRSCKSNWRVALIFNRFLLWGFRLQETHHAFAYFYALPLGFIQRFYRAELRLRDLKPILTRLPPRRFSLIRLGFHMIRFGSRPSQERATATPSHE